MSATIIGENAVAIKWSAAPRAEHYRVWKNVEGTDAEPVPVGSPADLDFTIENLPADTDVHVFVSAVNNSGESRLSEAVLVNTAGVSCSASITVQSFRIR
ncbi:MAG: fibronectin type III domain-containing protein [Limisphaerales bacterium]